MYRQVSFLVVTQAFQMPVVTGFVGLLVCYRIRDIDGHNE